MSDPNTNPVSGNVTDKELEHGLSSEQSTTVDTSSHDHVHVPPQNEDRNGTDDDLEKANPPPQEEKPFEPEASRSAFRDGNHHACPLHLPISRRIGHDHHDYSCAHHRGPFPISVWLRMGRFCISAWCCFSCTRVG